MRVMTISGAFAVVVVATVAVAGLVARNAWIKNKIAALSGPPAIAFAEDNSHLPSKRDRLRVVLIGDSSFGRLPTGKVDDRWQFINRGVGGETTAQIAQRFDRDALALSPDVVVLWAGVNDLVAAEFLDPAARRATVDRTFETLVDLRAAGPVGACASSWRRSRPHRARTCCVCLCGGSPSGTPSPTSIAGSENSARNRESVSLISPRRLTVATVEPLKRTVRIRCT